MAGMFGDLRPLGESELANIHGGMFGPFVNSGRSERRPVAPRVPSGSLGKEIFQGAVQGGFAVAATGAPPPAIASGATAGGILGGIGHCIQNIHIPPGKPVNLAVTAKVGPFGASLRKRA